MDPGMQILMAAVALLLSIHSAQSSWNGCAMHTAEESVPLLQEAEHWELAPSTACSAAATENQDKLLNKKCLIIDFWLIRWGFFLI